MILFVLAILLFLIGLYGVLVKRNLIKMIIGLMIMEYAVNLIFTLVGYRSGGTAPIVTDSISSVLYVDRFGNHSIGRIFCCSDLREIRHF